jgi:hypothetical protein
MPFKVHLLIVAIIIAAVYIIWGIMHTAAPVVQAGDPKTMSRMIAVTHASWGLNCRNVMISNDDNAQDAFGTGKQPNPKLSEDNVFSAVSLMCNGKSQCEVPASDPQLGEDPAPDCAIKNLEIEYRCFSYDRPWKVKLSSGVAKLQCASNKSGGK